jgi:HK97 family phage major capsid protein/HK97 family phage prohead protease
MADRPEAGAVEQRAAPDTLRVEGRKLRGLIPYNVESRDLGGWRERMAPGCLRNADLADLVVTVDHAGVPLGRFPTTLNTEDGDDGLHWSCELAESRADVREAVERGDLRASSWRMVVARDHWDGDLRTVEEVRSLRDVSVVTTPAYPAASAELRTAPDPEPPEEERADTQPQPEEATVPEENKGGGLTVEARNATDDHGNVEARVFDAMASVPKGESRSLTHATSAPVTPQDLQTFLWDLLRDQAVVIASGVRVIDTARKSVKFPTLTGDIVADFFDELEEITESDPGFDEFEIEPKAIKALVRGSAEAFEDSDPDLLRVVTSNLATILSLKLDRECLVGNASKGFKGMANMTGVQSLAVDGALTDYDPFIKALGMLAEQHVAGPYAVVMHPRVATALDLLKEFTTAEANVALPRPANFPPVYVTSQLPVSGGADPASTVLVYAPSRIILGRRRDTTIEVDRSQEFTNDAVLVRGKVRAALGTPYPQAIVKLTGVASPPIS